jgi:hypothetical protein
MKRSQRPEGSEIGSTFRSLSQECEGLVVSSNRLEDCGLLDTYNRRISSEPLRPLKVGQGVGKAMECGPRPSAGEEGHAVSRGIASELLGALFSPLVIGNATQDVPPQGNQVNELGLIADSEKPRPGLSLLPFDLRLQIPQREDSRRREELPIDHLTGC